MGWYIRKSKSIGPIRLNLSKSGIGMSVGVKGCRVSKGPKGTYLNAGRHGIYYRKKLNIPKQREEKITDERNKSTVTSRTNKIHINRNYQFASYSGFGTVSFGGNAIAEIHYRPASVFSKGRLAFSIKHDVNWKPDQISILNGFDNNSLPKDDFTFVEFKKNSNNTIRLLAKQVAEDIGQKLIVD